MRKMLSPDKREEQEKMTMEALQNSYDVKFTVEKHIEDLLREGFSINEVAAIGKLIHERAYKESNKMVYAKPTNHPIIRNLIIFRYGSYKAFCSKHNFSPTKLSRIMSGDMPFYSSKHMVELLERNFAPKTKENQPSGTNADF